MIRLFCLFLFCWILCPTLTGSAPQLMLAQDTLGVRVSWWYPWVFFPCFYSLYNIIHARCNEHVIFTRTKVIKRFKKESEAWTNQIPKHIIILDFADLFLMIFDDWLFVMKVPAPGFKKWNIKEVAYFKWRYSLLGTCFVRVAEGNGYTANFNGYSLQALGGNLYCNCFFVLPNGWLSSLKAKVIYLVHFLITTCFYSYASYASNTVCLEFFFVGDVFYGLYHGNHHHEEIHHLGD